jgi:hypothetical protein
MKRVLVIIYELANAELGFMLAREAQRRGGFDVVMWSPYCFSETPELVSRAIAERSVLIHEFGLTGSLADIWTPVSGWLSARPARLPVEAPPPAPHPGLRPALADLAGVWGADAPARLDDARRQADAALRRTGFCEDIMVRLGVDALVLAEDNAERDSCAWIEAARRRGIPSIVVSYGALSENEAEEAYKLSPAHRIAALEAEALARHLPHWLKRGPGYAITRLPLAEALGREIAGLGVENPWIVNSGRLDAIVLESPAAAAAYAAAGASQVRLRPIGHPFHDRLAAVAARRSEVRGELASRFGLDPAARWLIAAMPPDNTAHRETSDRSTYEQLMDDFCIRPRGMLGWNLIVSPHPNVSAERRQAIRDAGAALAEGPVADILPVADAYLSSVSSTIKWALALGLPVIDYDCYGYRYGDFIAEPGVRTAVDRAELHRQLADLGREETFDRWRMASQERSGWWGRLDGGAMDRLLRLALDDGATA